jgi:hypothetical protein
MKKRIFKHWKTSIIGVVLLAISAIALLTGKATMTEFYISLPTILGFIYVKDTILKKNVKETL